MIFRPAVAPAFMHWLDANPAKAQTVATFALLLVTAIYTFSTWSMARNARRSQRPYIFVDLLPNNYSTLDFQIGNSGERAAEHVTVWMDPVSGSPLSLIGGLPPLIDGIRYLPPSRRYQYNLFPKQGDSPLIFWGRGIPTTVTIHLRYKSGREKFRDTLHVDIAPMNGALIQPLQSPADRIAANLSDINHALRPLSHREQQNPFIAIRGTNCPFCLSRLDHGTRRCKYCLEWIDVTTDVASESPSAPTDDDDS